MALYDAIGKNYAITRQSDDRIAAKLLEILIPSPATILDIGAGTGSYANVLAECGYRVLAIESSETMRNQAIAHFAVEWLSGSAESLPLPDSAADAAIIMLAFHHFSDSRGAIAEIKRVIGSGQIIIFTFDPAKIADFWLTEYFPSLIEDVRSTFLPLSQLVGNLQQIAGRKVDIIPFPLPCDLFDSFAAVGWARPELYLESTIRNGISSFSKIDANELNEGLQCLQKDLQSGVWDSKYGHLRQETERDIGYCFLHHPATNLGIA